MIMINFSTVLLSDKQWMEPLLKTADFSGCHQNFTNIFAWSEIYNYLVAKVDNYLIVKGCVDDLTYYFYPAGWGDIKPVLETMRRDAMDCHHDFVISGVSPENMTVLRDLYPDNFTYEEMRYGFDYVYYLDKLVTLAGNKLHSKRNHINRFEKDSDWSFEAISTDNIGECWKMNVEWCKAHKTNDNDDIDKESCAVRRCFKNFHELGLEGGLIRSKGNVIAYTMGEILNSDTYVIHIEKAFADIQGAYQLINREFSKYVQQNHPHIVYMNREEDMGLEGLRKAKLSYYPDKMEEKYIARFFELNN